jgi:ribosomal protein S18 acetylase RimI-like enzyme
VLAAAVTDDTPAHPLDNPVWFSLLGQHAELGQVIEVDGERAGRYQRDVSPFGALQHPGHPGSWLALDELLEGRAVALIIDPDRVPAGWDVIGAIAGVQMDGSEMISASADSDLVELGAEQVADMVALVERTIPGPFLSRTVEMGRYVGYRHEGELVAMAGERLQPTGWTEISAVCTDEAFRGRGLATRCLGDVVAAIRQRGERPFLHAVASNTTAIELYRSLGFSIRQTVTFTSARKARG